MGLHFVFSCLLVLGDGCGSRSARTLSTSPAREASYKRSQEACSARSMAASLSFACSATSFSRVFSNSSKCTSRSFKWCAFSCCSRSFASLSCRAAACRSLSCAFFFSFSSASFALAFAVCRIELSDPFANRGAAICLLLLSDTIGAPPRPCTFRCEDCLLVAEPSRAESFLSPPPLVFALLEPPLRDDACVDTIDPLREALLAGAFVLSTPLSLLRAVPPRTSSLPLMSMLPLLSCGMPSVLTSPLSPPAVAATSLTMVDPSAEGSLFVILSLMSPDSAAAPSDCEC
mmetsp:Transcript_21398/g.51918  ORF Transcript_21398/g.51918 Transcript_21398/m.51918 type:complete len:288 (+) Transcript_21398:561-1424(+)